MNDIMSKVKSSLTGLGKKTNEAYEITKTKIDITKFKSRNKNITKKIGEHVVQTEADGAKTINFNESPMSDWFDELHENLAKIAELQKKTQEP